METDQEDRQDNVRVIVQLGNLNMINQQDMFGLISTIIPKITSLKSTI